MSIVRLLLFFTMLLATSVFVTKTSIVPTNMLTAANTTKPGCPRTCGNLTIPYPFGIKGCNFDVDYEIVCNTSYNPPRAQIPISGVGPGDDTVYQDILYISETQMMVRSLVGYKCYGSKGEVVSDYELSMGIGFPYNLSPTSNKLVLVGYDDVAVLESNTGVLSGCYSRILDYAYDMKSETCGLSNGCCYSPLSSDLLSFYVTLSKGKGIDGYWRNMSRCSYVFIAGNESFKYSGESDIDDSNTLVNKLTNQVYLEFDWVVGSLVNCSEAKKTNDTSFACQSNTQCIDNEKGGHGNGNGYQCQCLSGYQGNPYIGCTDIDECLGGSKSPCSMICLNTPGSYKCSCPTGYDGDGSKSGTGCTKISISSLSSIKLALGLRVSFGFLLVLLGVSLGSLLVLLFVWWLSLVIKRRRAITQKAKYFKRNGGLLLQQKMSSVEVVEQRINIHFFTAYQLEKATDHFNKNRILGQGGQGTVYKGMLAEGKVVAIKKSKIVEESNIGEFINEVAILSQINHRNIVKLLGCCLETEVPLLVYEFIPNGTLFQHIHDASEEFQITWKMRLQIASDSAGALAYLHSSSAIPIFHRDVKSSNILLDNKYRAKLSDFGTSRSVAIDQTHVTTRVMGTPGYLDPEYFQSSQFTEKSDVYSFGVVLVELLTGQKAIRTSEQGTGSLTAWFLHHMDNSLLMDVIDSQILQDGSEEEFMKVAILANRCLDSDGKRRPTMKEVLQEIEAIMSHHLPKITQENRPKSEQRLVGAAKSYFNRFSKTRTLEIESNSYDSAELSLLYNPR